MTTPPARLIKVPAKVLACLRPGYLTVFVGYGLRMANGGMPDDIPMDLVPFDLRMPNSEFTVVMDRTNGRFVGVERQSGDGPLRNGPEAAAGE